MSVIEEGQFSRRRKVEDSGSNGEYDEATE